MQFETYDFEGYLQLACFPLDTGGVLEVNWTYVRRSEGVLEAFYMFSVRSIYVLCPGGVKLIVSNLQSDLFETAYFELHISNFKWY